MNQTMKSVRSSLSSSRTQKKSFRVLVKNRITHQIMDPQQKNIQSSNDLMKNTINSQSFQQAKNNLKKYIRNMKASSKISHYQSKIATNRSSCPHIQKPQKLNSSRIALSSRKQLNKLLSPNINQNQQTPFDKYKQHRQYLNLSVTPSDTADYKLKLQTQPNQEDSINRLPALRSSLQQYQQVGSSKYRLSDLQNKIQSLLFQKVKILSSTDFFSTHQKRNKTAFKLLQKQMDRILGQIKKIKQTQQFAHNTILQDSQQKDQQINRNIQMLQKKVKIFQRLIAQKLFESDNLKNQYLLKIKQHKKHNSENQCIRNSKSSTFYRQANKLNPSNFKPTGYSKQTICANQMTTNKADYKMPLKSYYITPHKDNFYNSNKLKQPLPRSTYNRQYLVYGTLPKNLITAKSHQKDNKIFATMTQNRQNKLDGSTYKQDFIQKIQKHPVNFKQFDAYKDKFKDLQVNYGKERNIEKVGNSKSVIEYYQEDLQIAKQKHRHLRTNSSIDNPQNSLPTLQISDYNKKAKLRIRLEQLSRSNDHLNVTEKKESMIEQESIQKHNLFNQRIKSQIKHKNLYDQKYKFKSDMMRQKIRRIDSSSRKNILKPHHTIVY